MTVNTKMTTNPGKEKNLTKPKVSRSFPGRHHEVVSFRRFMMVQTIRYFSKAGGASANSRREVSNPRRPIRP